MYSFIVAAVAANTTLLTSLSSQIPLNMVKITAPIKPISGIADRTVGWGGGEIYMVLVSAAWRCGGL